MDFARHQRNPLRHLIGVGSVILLHVLIVYALFTGLARKVVEVVKGPIEVKVIEEQIQKPPPPPELLPPPPKLAAPPPPFIPPPEINIAPPPTPAPTITAVTPEAPPAPQAPVIAKVDPTPQPAPAPAVQAASVVCPNYRQIIGSMAYPREARLEGIEGEVNIEFTVAANGSVRDVVIKSSSHRVFNRESLRAVSSLTCQGQGRDIRVVAPISFKLTN
jgi:periplasmic protein TonB